MHSEQAHLSIGLLDRIAQLCSLTNTKPQHTLHPRLAAEEMY